MINRGHYGATDLAGVKWAWAFYWPGAVHLGEGHRILILDADTTQEQREALIALLHWGDRYSPSPEGPRRLIVHKECGGTVSERGICKSCGKVLHARDAKQIPGPGAKIEAEHTGATID